MPDDIYVASMYGHNTKQALVSLKVKDVAVQMLVEDARKLAHDLLDACEAAAQDGFVVEFMQGRVGLSEAQAAQILKDFREWRELHRA